MVSRTDRFERMFRELADYRSKHGTCEVPKCCKDNPALGYWVASQRAREAKGRLSPEDTRRLAALGFRFANGRPFSDADIHRRLEVLSAFRRETGRGIPVKQDSNPDYSSLAQWIYRARRHFAGGRLSSLAVQKLAAADIQIDRFPNKLKGGSILENKRFLENCTLLRNVVADRKRLGSSDLSYADAKSCDITRRAYRFIEHLILKARQALLSEEHRQCIIGMDFTFNGRAVSEVLHPSSSIRLPDTNHHGCAGAEDMGCRSDPKPPRLDAHRETAECLDPYGPLHCLPT